MIMIRITLIIVSSAIMSVFSTLILCDYMKIQKPDSNTAFWLFYIMWLTMQFAHIKSE